MSKFKRIIVTIACVTLIFGSIPFVLGAANSKYNPNAGFNYEAVNQSKSIFTSQSVEVSNADLSNENKDNFIFSKDIQNWDKKSTDATTIAGALNLSQFNKFKNDNIKGDLKYLATPPMTLNNNAVFVLSNNYTDLTASKASFTSPDVEFKPDSYYIASVDFYAVGGFGSFYLVPAVKDLDDAYIPVIKLPQVNYSTSLEKDPTTGEYTNAYKSSWKTAQFFVKTDVMESQNFKIGLYLGSMSAESRGAIYFQNPRIDQVSQETYERIKFEELADMKEAHLKLELDLQDKDIVKKNFKIDEPRDYTFIQNYYDENQVPSAEQSGTYARPSVSAASVPTLLNFENTDYLYLAKPSGTKAGSVGLLAANYDEVSLKLSQPFLVKRHQIYMVSFYSLTKNGQHSSVRFRDTQWRTKKDGEFFDSGHKSILMSGTSELNGWALNTFFLTGESYYDTLIDIELWVGQHDNPANDYFLFDGFKIQRVSNEYFEANGKGLTENSMLLDKNTATSNINNAYFNIGTIASVEKPYPLKAADWTLNFDEKDKDAILSGIVNTDWEHWSEYAYAGIDKADNYGNAIHRPINATNPNNNVYMLQNKGTSHQTLSSNSIALNVGVTNIISFNLMRQYIPSDGIVLDVTAVMNGRDIAKLPLSISKDYGSSFITTDWEQYTIAIKESAYTGHQVTLNFNLGSEKQPCPAAAVFIDNVRLNQTADQVSANAYGDLADTLDFFEGDGNKSTVVSRFGDALYIANNNRTSAAKIKNTLPETIKGNNFYEYRVRVKFNNDMEYYYLGLPNYPESTNIKDFNNLEIKKLSDFEYGLNFTIENFKNGITNIQYADVKNMEIYDDNGFTELVFYIRPDTDDELSLVITFGDENVAVVGNIFIESATLKPIDEEDFNSAQEKYKKLDSAKSKHVAFITESYSPEEVKPVKTKSPVQWYIVVPSVLTALAVLIALIGIIARKFKFRHHIDKYYTSYTSDDRSLRTK
jgi:hypothetical protein